MTLRFYQTTTSGKAQSSHTVSVSHDVRQGTSSIPCHESRLAHRRGMALSPLILGRSIPVDPAVAREVPLGYDKVSGVSRTFSDSVWIHMDICIYIYMSINRCINRYIYIYITYIYIYIHSMYTT